MRIEHSEAPSTSGTGDEVGQGDALKLGGKLQGATLSRRDDQGDALGHGGCIGMPLGKLLADEKPRRTREAGQ